MRIDKIYSDMVEYLKEKVGKQEKPGVEEKVGGNKASLEVEIKNRVEVELESVSREKVEAIKAAINSGNYKVDVHKISEAMLKEFLGG